MQDLKVIGVENGALLVASDEGTRYRIEVDDAFQAQLRRARPTESGTDRKVPPREIQAHIRAGMSAADVSAVTGASLEYIERFEGPVVAEREYVVESALNVTVHVAGDTDPLAGSTFGSVIRTRLADGGATDERWASWKDAETGWIVKLTFTAETVEHDARWSFDPRKQALSPLNAEAISLSQQGEAPASLIPRLRAVPFDGAEGGSTRFDSGAFSVSTDDDGPLVEAINYGRPEVAPMNQTADLLEALRRRRGERDQLVHDELSLDDESSRAAHPSTGTIRLVEVPLDGFGDAEAEETDLGALDDDQDAADLDDQQELEPDTGSTAEFPASGLPVSARRDSVSDFPTTLSDAAPPRPADASSVSAPHPTSATTGSKSSRRGRASMPSWDEIVFGARTDDD